jgi:hypothetical protein
MRTFPATLFIPCACRRPGLDNAGLSTLDRDDEFGADLAAWLKARVPVQS